MTSSDHPTIAAPVAILGGTGDFGSGLAKRLAVAGVEVIVGARTSAEAESAAATIREAARAQGVEATVRGATIAEAARAAGMAVVALPHGALPEVFGDPAVAAALAGKAVLSCVVPMCWEQGAPPAYVPLAEGSAAEQIAALLPASHVASALHDISAWSLHQLPEPIPSDVFVAAADPIARAAALALAAALPVHAVVDVGPLRMSRETERLTVLICQVNRVTHQHTSVELSGIERPQGLRPAAELG